MVIGACPYPCPSSRHPCEPTAFSTTPSSPHPPLSLPFLPSDHEKRGRAEARPLPCHLTSEQVWSFLSRIHSKRRLSSPSHCRSYPKCRIGGIGRLAANRLRSASGRIPLGHRRSCRFPLRRLRDAPIIQPRLRLPSTRRCSLARGRQSARGT